MMQSGHDEILAAINFYSERGSDWLDVVCYLALKHTGRLDAYINPYAYRTGIGIGRPRGNAVLGTAKREHRGADTLGRGKPSNKQDSQGGRT